MVLTLIHDIVPIMQLTIISCCLCTSEMSLVNNYTLTWTYKQVLIHEQNDLESQQYHW